MKYGRAKRLAVAAGITLAMLAGATRVGANGILEACRGDGTLTVSTPGQVEVQYVQYGPWVAVDKTFATAGVRSVRVGDADRPLGTLWNQSPNCPTPTTTTTSTTVAVTTTTESPDADHETTTTVVTPTTASRVSPSTLIGATSTSFDVGEHAPSVGPDPSTLTLPETGKGETVGWFLVGWFLIFVGAAVAYVYGPRRSE